MSDTYFVIYFGEDGISLEVTTKLKIESDLERVAKYGEDYKYIESVKIGDTFYSGGGKYPMYSQMIVKGELVVPKKKEVVIKYEI